MMMTMTSRVYAVWFLVFLVVVSLVVLSYYAEKDTTYSTAHAQLPSTWMDGSSSSSGSSPSASLLALVSLLALLGVLPTLYNYSAHTCNTTVSGVGFLTNCKEEDKHLRGTIRMATEI